MFAARDIILFALVAGLPAAIVLAIWAWARTHGRFMLAGVATTAGFIAWNPVRNAINGRNFNIDAPVIGLSWADAGSGVLAFVATPLVLGVLIERRELAKRVVGAAAIAGLAALVVHLFVL